MKKQEYKNLSINEKINYRAELKKKKEFKECVFKVAEIGMEIFFDFFKKQIEKNKNKNIYQLIK